jgi:hypothetical protein
VPGASTHDVRVVYGQQWKTRAQVTLNGAACRYHDDCGVLDESGGMTTATFFHSRFEG